LFLAEDGQLNEYKLISQLYDAVANTLVLTLGKGEEKITRLFKDKDRLNVYASHDNFKSGSPLRPEVLPDGFAAYFHTRGGLKAHITETDEETGTIYVKGYEMTDIGVTATTRVLTSVTPIVRSRFDAEYAATDKPFYANPEDCINHERYLYVAEDGTKTEQGGWLADLILNDEQRAVVDALQTAINKVNELGCNILFDRCDCDLMVTGGGIKYKFSTRDWMYGEDANILCDIAWNDENRIGLSGVTDIAECPVLVESDQHSGVISKGHSHESGGGLFVWLGQLFHEEKVCRSSHHHPHFKMRNMPDASGRIRIQLPEFSGIFL